MNADADASPERWGEKFSADGTHALQAHNGDASRAILEHLGLPTKPPPLGAVGPPEPVRDDAFA